MSLGTPTLPPVCSDDYSRLSGYIPAGFWHRFFAFVIDGIIVAIPCFTAAEVFQGFLAHSPGWAALLGFAITTSYFAVFGSDLVDGQTFGMMATRARVVASDGSTLSLQRSFLRYTVLFAPFLLTSAVLPAATPSPVAYVYETATAAAGTIIIYLAIFNRRTGQSLHDLATSTFVADSSGAGPVHADPFWKPHWAILLGLLMLGFISSLAVPHMSSTLGEVMSVENSVAHTPGITEANVVIKFSGNQSGIIVTTGCDQLSEDHTKAAARIVVAVLNGDAKAVEHDYIEIDCVKTVQVGFVKSTTHDPISHTPREWQTLTQN